MAEQQQKPDMAAIMATPEFQKAVQEAATRAAAEAVARLAQGSTPSAAADDSTKQLFSEMALAIANMSNQGGGRAKPVAPEVMQRRMAAAERADKLIRAARAKAKEARDRGDKDQEIAWTPRYRVVAKVYLNERFIEPFRKLDNRQIVASEIYWTGMPNEGMRPLNGVAEEIYDAYREAIGSTSRLKSISGPNGGQVAQDNRPYWVTPAGLVVIGDAPPKAFVAARVDHADDLGAPTDNNDPNSPTVHVLGTVAPPARRTAADLAVLRQAG